MPRTLNDLITLMGDALLGGTDANEAVKILNEQAHLIAVKETNIPAYYLTDEDGTFESSNLYRLYYQTVATVIEKVLIGVAQRQTNFKDFG